MLCYCPQATDVSLARGWSRSGSGKSRLMRATETKMNKGIRQLCSQDSCETIWPNSKSSKVSENRLRLTCQTLDLLGLVPVTSAFFFICAAVVSHVARTVGTRPDLSLQSRCNGTNKKNGTDLVIRGSFFWAFFQFHMFHLHSQSPGWPNGGVCHERVDTTSQFSLKSFTDSWWFLGLSYPSVAKDHHYALETCEMPCLPASISTSLQRWKRSSLQAKLCQTQNIATHVVHAGPMSDVCRTCISLYAL